MLQVDKQELKELLTGIVAENKTGNPNGIRFPECRKCSKWAKKTKTCSIYPNRIPEKIFWGEESCTEIQAI